MRSGQCEICEATRDAGLVAGASGGRSGLIFRRKRIHIGEIRGVQGHHEVRQRAGELGFVRVGEREQDGRFVDWRFQSNLSALYAVCGLCFDWTGLAHPHRRIRRFGDSRSRLLAIFLVHRRFSDEISRRSFDWSSRKSSKMVPSSSCLETRRRGPAAQVCIFVRRWARNCSCTCGFRSLARVHERQ